VKLASECMSCLIEQIERAIRLLQPSAPNSLIVETQHRLMKYISDHKPNSLRSEDLGTITYQYIAESLGIKDPYKEQKAMYNQLALDIYPKILEFVKNSEDPLQHAITASIMGNCIDFGSPLSIDFEEFHKFSGSTLGENNQYEIFLHALDKAKKILILGDNTGEIVFDKIMVKILTETYPNKKFIFAVRGGPIINDATMEDAISIGLTEVCEVIESSASPGAIVKHSPLKFQRIFQEADLIVSKGQGNFESIISTPTTQNVFFFLKAKCKLISRVFGVPVGTLLLRKKTDELVSATEI